MAGSRGRPRRAGSRRLASRIETAAAEAGRSGVRRRHALQLWADSRTRAPRLGSSWAARWRRHGLPFERFGRYAPCGPPAAIADALAPYLAVGCRRFNFVPEGTSLPAAIEAAAEVNALLTEDPLSPSSADL
jgi:hypothetical protein